jgi:hypothetical protein
MFDEDEVSDTLDNIGNNMPMLATHTLNDLEQTAATLCVDEPEIELHNWLNLTSVLLARARQIRKQIEQITIKWIEANGPLLVGDIEYTVGYRKEVRCRDTLKCLNMLLDSTHGDVAALADYLRTDPYKYGSVRSLLGTTAFDTVFTTQQRPKLESGVPTKELMQTNTRYLQSRGRS